MRSGGGSVDVAGGDGLDGVYLDAGTRIRLVALWSWRNAAVVFDLVI
jgi:hypothetical protein